MTLPKERAFVLSLSRFDKIVLLILAGLIGAIVLIILLGDRVGVTLDRVGPLGVARSTAPILLQFSELMNRDTLNSRLRVVQVQPETEPEHFQETDVIAPVSGSIRWNSKTAFFQPTAALIPGASYTVILDKGVSSEIGREVLSEYRFTFQVRHPHIAYLSPSTGMYNIWIVDPNDLTSARQVTFTSSGIYDYSISPDGSKIAFSERNSNTGTSDIKILDLDTGLVQQLTNCPDANCTTPTWRPDGQVIGYERVEFNSNFNQVGVSAPRIWLLDLNTTPPGTRPLFSDSQSVGYGLQWSADSNRVTVFDPSVNGILFYQFAPETTIIIPSRYGSAGALSSDGTRLVYPEILFNENQARSVLQIVDLQTQEITSLTSFDNLSDDEGAVWRPDGKMLAVGRRYLDENRFTRSKQLYLMNPDDGSVEELLIDPLYILGSFSWDPNGTQLLLQRFPDAAALNAPTNSGKPEIWMMNLTTKALVKIADDAFSAQWVP